MDYFAIIDKNMFHAQSHSESLRYIMKISYYIKLVAPIGLFGILFRLMEIIFAIEKDTAFYVRNSVIPTLFNIYCILATVFFLSALFLIAKEKKPSIGRLARLNLPEEIIALVAATLILASSAKTFLFSWLIDGTYRSFGDAVPSLEFFGLIFGLISAFILIQFATSAKQSLKRAADRLLLLALPIYFILKLFKLFTNIETILHHAYTSFRIISLAIIVLALVNLIKISVGACSRKYFTVFTLIAFFFTVMRLAELIISLFPDNPYNIDMDILDFGADLATSVFLLAMAYRLSKKPERKQKEEPRLSTDIPKQIEN